MVTIEIFLWKIGTFHKCGSFMKIQIALRELGYFHLWEDKSINIVKIVKNRENLEHQQNRSEYEKNHEKHKNVQSNVISNKKFQNFT